MEKAGAFDIIHNHFDFLPLTYSALSKIPVITTIHGFSSKQIIPVYKKYNASSHYVSISNADRSPELDYIATVYNGINTKDFEFSAKPEDHLLYFGRIHHDKGTSEAIDIAKKSGHKLIISGIIQDENYFREKIEPRLDDQVVYIGPAGPEKRNMLLGSAKALLHPINFNEPFGLSVAEAMLCGTPTIAFNKGAMPELIRPGTGFLVRNVEEAVKAVAQLSHIKREDCRDWALSQFSSEKMVNDYLALYQKILS
jgi:glycosyltransferase involved in cell wall biosynthesis